MVLRQFRRFSVIFSISALLLFAFSPAVRGFSLQFVRFPFALLAASAKTLILVPQLPGIASRQRELKQLLAERELEIAGLREALRRTEQALALAKALPERQGLLVPVLGRSLLPTQHSLMLGRGRNAGVVSDSAVLTGDGLIGRVVETHADTSLVMMLTDPESRIAALVERSREAGLIAGRGRGLLELIYLDADADVRAGDKIVTAGLSAAHPKGLPLGEVVRIERNVASGSATAWVKPAARLGFLEDVLCLAPSPQ